MPDKEKIELRSEEVQEILTRIPPWIIRWGNILVLSIVLLLLSIAAIIKYPDIISAQIIITTQVPPQKIIAKTSGKMDAIFVDNGNEIKKNSPIAVLENAANYKDVFLLKRIIDTINIEKSDFPFAKIKASQLGDIESSYALFQKEYSVEKLNADLKPFKVEGNAQSYEAIQLKERLNLLISQKEINESEMLLQKNDLERYETLFKKGIIATAEIEKQRLIFLQSQKAYKNMLSSISQLKSSLIDLNRNSKTTQINESKENVNLERNYIQAFYQLKKAIKDWELNYVFTASIDGKVSFLQLWAVNQTVASGDNVFTIIPNNETNYIGKLKAVALNSGKIKINQDVNIRLANYPDNEFGLINGKIKAISLTPDKDGNLLIDVSLPNGLITSYDKKIIFQQEMSGSADIVTEDLTLLERLLYQFRNVFKR
jgi:multidrug resistance efflux pump